MVSVGKDNISILSVPTGASLTLIRGNDAMRKVMHQNDRLNIFNLQNYGSTVEWLVKLSLQTKQI